MIEQKTKDIISNRDTQIKLIQKEKDKLLDK